MVKLVTERHGVVALARIPYVLFDSIAVVRDALAATEPASAVRALLIRTLGHNLRVNTDFHAEIEERVRLCEVHYVECTTHIFPRIFDLKEEPLGVSIRVDVILHQQVVLGV